MLYFGVGKKSLEENIEVSHEFYIQNIFVIYLQIKLMENMLETDSVLL